MSSNFQKASSQIFLTLFIGVIVISFMFSGPFLNSGTPDSIGTVGPHSIKAREFQMEVDRQSKFYANFMNGGNPLTSKQLRQFKIYDNAIRSLVMSKLRFILADEMGLVVSNAEVIDQIKEAPYFKTGDQFDVNRYKQLLAANRLTPEDFEADTRNQIKGEKINAIITSFPISQNLSNDLNKLYRDTKTVKVVTLNTAELKKTVAVSEKEAKDFLKEEVNTARIKSIFEQRKDSLGQKHQVKARHILFKTDKDAAKAFAKANEIKKIVNKKNFESLAKKHTDEQVGKTSGGNLNWVSRGQMVKPFEDKLFSMKKGEISEPIKTQFGYHIIYAEDVKEEKVAKFDDHKIKLAIESIQKDKDVKELFNKAVSDIEARLKNKKSIKSITSKYKLAVTENQSINRLEGDKGTFNLTPEQLDQLFTKDTKVLTFNEGSKATFIQVIDSKMTEDNFELTSTKNILGRKITQSLLEKLGESYEYKQNSAARLPN